MNALIVDDSTATRLILCRMLQQLGFAVAQAASGPDGLRHLRQQPAPDLVLVDWNMPDMDGGEFIRQARADTRLARVQFLLVTGEENQALLNDTMQGGANGCLRKPFTRDKLLATLSLLDLSVPVS